MKIEEATQILLKIFTFFRNVLAETTLKYIYYHIVLIF